ncbi:heterokaryon incompatibility protein-domain-containing protein [Hypoxylon crocopeplum]|nr:heterokaryon incompatibility protein-domain-containing protein [Hypoxylon crocopeplum]
MGSVDWAHTWTCIEKHEKCESFRQKPLPARVLDLGSKPVDSIKLLSITDGSKHAYACLSHCWGKPKAGQPGTITLTTQNESLLKRGTALDHLPRNYRDAIHFCRLLDIRYLWTDALCIIQDSAEDWAGESLKMGSYNGNSLVCLAATRSPDHDGGLQPIETRMEYQLAGTTGPAKKCPHEEYYPLLIRAWVYQERRLSPRVLHFCGNELVFECFRP